MLVDPSAKGPGQAMSTSMMLFRSFVRQTLPLGLLVAFAGCAPASQSAPPARGASLAAADAGLAVAPSGDAGAGQGGEAAVASASPIESTSEADMVQDKDELDDGAESMAPEGMTGQTIKHPLDGWTKQQIDVALAKDPESLGSMSIGFTNAGALYNGVQMPPAKLGSSRIPTTLGERAKRSMRSHTASTRSANSSPAPPRCSSDTSVRTAAGTSRLMSATRRGATSTSATTTCPASRAGMPPLAKTTSTARGPGPS